MSNKLGLCLTISDKRLILDEVKQAFVNNDMKALDKTKISYKIVKYVSAEYMAFYKEFIEAIFEVFMHMYKEHGVSSREEIIAVLSNKRYHNLEDWELKEIYKWIEGQDIYESCKAGFYDDNFLIEDVEEIIEHVLSENYTQNV